jgi:hypothetical protein
MLAKIVQVQTRAGKPLEIRRTAGPPTAVVPYSKAITIQFPFGAFVWNRPFAVEVRDGENRRRLPIVDITRTVQLGLYALGFIFSGTALVQLLLRRKY